MEGNWYEIQNDHEIATPALLVYPDRITYNIKRMIEIAGDVNRLRPHVKTYKNAEIIRMQQAYGIHKFKCATIAEAELLAQCMAGDVLIAMQLVGQNVTRFYELVKTYPETRFSTLVDDLGHAKLLSDISCQNGLITPMWLDINVGMNRTGIIPDKSAQELYKYLSVNKHIQAMGFHVYDGHLRDSDFEQRKNQCDASFGSVLQLKEDLSAQGINVDTIIAGGSPSFPIHALRKDVELSPGTVLLWDAGYGKRFPEMDMQVAAVLISRVLSKPVEGIITSDLGHKSIAPEMNFPRIELLNAKDLEQVSQSEEHFVFKTNQWESYKIGDLIYGIPMHICPTVAKYQYLQVVKSAKVVGRWKVGARGQKISI
ncbi:D-TA family PLP-dependent enzyme [Galbibacter sp.]|uniref:D-TA family PLP-dependent enzyme n=1 Tax=Galbibacter sp. TaxID=2918471 RepID=UPI002CC949B0|nr:D-TA family PLP-dependent enzyme [Galbibacter sp.]HLV63763.1 D-TA family PLP-dependent enzyme [Galbibacter sp.]